MISKGIFKRALKEIVPEDVHLHISHLFPLSKYKSDHPVTSVVWNCTALPCLQRPGSSFFKPITGLYVISGKNRVGQIDLLFTFPGISELVEAVSKAVGYTP